MDTISIKNIEAEKAIYKDMHTLITELKKTKNISGFNNLATNLCDLYDLAQDHDLYNGPKVADYISRPIEAEINEERYRLFCKNYNKFLSLVLKDKEYHEEFAEQYYLFFKNNFVQDYRPLNVIKDFNESLTYAKEFMSYYDKSLLEAFNILEKNNHILLDYYYGIGYDGLFVNLGHNMIPYFSFYLNNNIDDGATIVHETAHLKQYNILRNNQTNADYSYFFREVYSHYIQLVFYKYIKDKNIFVDDIDVCFNNFLNYLYKYLMEFREDLDAENYDTTDLYGEIQYCYGGLMALSYYDMYTQDPEKAKYYIKEFLEKSYKMDPMDVINGFGLNKEELAEGVVLDKYLKKIKV